MKTQHAMASPTLGGDTGRRVRFEKRVEPRVLKMRARTRKRSSEESPASELLAEALGALVLLLAMFLLLIAPD